MENIQYIIMEYTNKIKEILGDKLSKVILYGSYARGDQRENSDIDLMVLTSLSDNEIEEVETAELILNCVKDFLAKS